MELKLAIDSLRLINQHTILVVTTKKLNWTADSPFKTFDRVGELHIKRNEL